MKVLVVYDSTYGHTQKIAQAMGEAIDAQVRRVDGVQPADLEGCDLLILGSPTHGGFPTEGIHELSKTAPSLEGAKVAAFDTRTKRTIFGYAAPKIARNLEKSGAHLRRGEQKCLQHKRTDSRLPTSPARGGRTSTPSEGSVASS
ncbi:MAG: flavodoxin family protein [Anaerolineales bacterium]